MNLRGILSVLALARVDKILMTGHTPPYWNNNNKSLSNMKQVKEV